MGCKPFANASNKPRNVITKSDIALLEEMAFRKTDAAGHLHARLARAHWVAAEL